MLHYRCCIMNEIQKVKFNITNIHIYNGSFKKKKIHITELNKIGGVFYIFRNQLIVDRNVKSTRQESPKNRSTPADRLFFFFTYCSYEEFFEMAYFWTPFECHTCTKGFQAQDSYGISTFGNRSNQASHVRITLSQADVANPNNYKRQQRAYIQLVMIIIKS